MYLTTRSTVYKTDRIATYSDNALSLPLFKSIKGSSSYRDKLRTFCRNLRDELLRGSGEDRVRFGYDLTLAFEAVIHSLAHVASNPASLEFVAISRSKNSYGDGSEYPMLTFPSVIKAVDLLRNVVIADKKDGYKLCTFVNGWYDKEIGKGVRSRLKATRHLEDRMVAAGLIWETHPRDVVPFNREGTLYLKASNGSVTQLERDPTDVESTISALNRTLEKCPVSIVFPDYRAYEQSWSDGLKFTEVGRSSTGSSRTMKTLVAVSPVIGRNRVQVR